MFRQSGPVFHRSLKAVLQRQHRHRQRGGGTGEGRRRLLNADQWQQSLRAGYATADRTAETVDWLIDLLQDGRVPSVEVHRLARERQVPRMVLFAAKKQAGAITYPDGCQGPWYWEIPKDEAPPDPPDPPEYIMTDIGVPILNPEYARRLALE